MKQVDPIFLLWDEQDGIRTSRAYADFESAVIALNEHYTTFWIQNEKAKILTVPVVSYVGPKVAT